VPRRVACRLAATTFLALAVRALVVLALSELAGAEAIRRPFEALGPGWIAAVAAAELLTYPAYLLALRSVARLGGHARPPVAIAARVVVAGFGPLALMGGSTIDREVLYALDGDEGSARARVRAMGTLEWAVLGPTTCAVAIGLLVSGADVSGSLLWPWAIGLPVGAAVAVWALAPERIETIPGRFGGRIAAPVARALAGIAAVAEMGRHPRRYAGAWIGTALYWAAEIAALYGAIHAVGLDLGPAETAIAYATGYLASRRSLPLAGAGLTEALLFYSLYELHAPLGPAVDAVIIYRAFNFMAVILPALIAYRGLRSTLAASRPD
jgi:uncharacterized membrane protein YbhN (UPF0104 family)